MNIPKKVKIRPCSNFCWQGDPRTITTNYVIFKQIFINGTFLFIAFGWVNPYVYLVVIIILSHKNKLTRYHNISYFEFNFDQKSTYTFYSRHYSILFDVIINFTYLMYFLFLLFSMYVTYIINNHKNKAYIKVHSSYICKICLHASPF